MSDADKPASLPQLKGMAEQLSDAADTAFDYTDLFASMLAPLYAELERKDAANDRMRKLLGECRPIVRCEVNSDEREYNLYPTNEYCKRDFEKSTDLLTRIDKEAGEK